MCRLLDGFRIHSEGCVSWDSAMLRSASISGRCQKKADVVLPVEIKGDLPGEIKGDLPGLDSWGLVSAHDMSDAVHVLRFGLRTFASTQLTLNYQDNRSWPAVKSQGPLAGTLDMNARRGGRMAIRPLALPIAVRGRWRNAA